jgi:hypothetical protein
MALFTLAGCPGVTPEEITTSLTDPIYAAGYHYDNITFQAYYWKNGSKHNLPAAGDSEIRAIAVADQ